MWPILLMCLALQSATGIPVETDFVVDYFENKNIPYVCYLGCGTQKDNKKLLQQFISEGIRVSLVLIGQSYDESLELSLRQWTSPVGVLLDGTCDGAQLLLRKASAQVLFDAMHSWLVLDNIEEECNYTKTTQIATQDVLQELNLSIDADIVLAYPEGDNIALMDVFNFGKIQGNILETKHVGMWNSATGLNISLNRFKYYDRWDFHNLTLRAITVILDRPKVFKPEMLSDPGYTPGVSVMTKIVTQLLFLLKEKHDFRTKFYYLILDKGVGDYENRFLTPLSAGVWWWTIAACAAFTAGLAVAAALEERKEPGLYAAFSVFAIICQQAYEDGINLFDEISFSQGRRMIFLAVGLMSMLLYNYYTSSVVSWLLNAAAPTLADMDALISTDLELVFEDIGYTRGWLDNPGFFYYSGYKNPKEDILRSKKVTNAKRTTPLLQAAAEGVNLIKSGEYAYHTEPYTAYQEISKTFDDKELCELGSLQMMAPAYVYIMAQKRSPYKQFFVWSLMRLLERGHISVARARASGHVPACSGQTPRALALGQAAPAFAVLAQVAIVAVMILFCEIIWHRIQSKKQTGSVNDNAHSAGRDGSGGEQKNNKGKRLGPRRVSQCDGAE